MGREVGKYNFFPWRELTVSVNNYGFRLGKNYLNEF